MTPTSRPFSDRPALREGIPLPPPRPCPCADCITERLAASKPVATQADERAP